MRQLQLEHDILKKANELLKKGLGVNLPLLSNQEKTRLVDALKDAYALPELFAELDLARSSYFYHRARLRLADKYADARLAITDVFERNHRCYGYRRLRAALGRQKFSLSERVVQRLMKQECLVVAAKKRRKYGSYLGEISPAPDNLINPATDLNSRVGELLPHRWQLFHNNHDWFLAMTACQRSIWNHLALTQVLGQVLGTTSDTTCAPA